MFITEPTLQAVEEMNKLATATIVEFTSTDLSAVPQPIVGKATNLLFEIGSNAKNTLDSITDLYNLEEVDVDALDRIQHRVASPDKDLMSLCSDAKYAIELIINISNNDSIKSTMESILKSIAKINNLSEEFTMHMIADFRSILFG